MSIVIFQNAPQLPEMSEREWYQPVRVETLSSFADAANNLAAVKGAGHFVHRFQWSRENGGLIQSDPGNLAAETFHRIVLPVRSPFSTHFTWALIFQAHRELSGSFEPIIELSISQGVQLTPPGVFGGGNLNQVDGKDDQNFGVKLLIGNRGIPDGGRVERRDDAGVVIPNQYDYPLLETRGLVVRSEVPQAGYPTSARALNYNFKAGNRDTLTLCVRSRFARPIQLSINEISPLLSG